MNNTPQLSKKLWFKETFLLISMFAYLVKAHGLHLRLLIFPYTIFQNL